MKKAKKLLAILPLLFMMAGCGEKSSSSDPTTTDNTVITTNNQDDKTDVRYQIYLSAVSAGYNGNYEEWLESIKGDSIQLKVENNYVMFKYSQATEWVNLISLDALKGDAGATGKNSKLQVADGFIQWQNEGDTTWNNLIALDDLKGVDGNSRKTDMRVNNDYIQWKYEGDTTWNDLLDLSTLKGTNGKNATMQVSGDYIQWKVDGEDEWTNLIEVASLKGDTGANGKKVSLTVADNFIKWQYEGDTSWNELISINDLKGDTGSVGKKSLMRNNGTYIQWQNDGDGENWNNLIALNDLAGAAGDAVELREENGIIQWKYDSDTDWTDLYDFNQNTQTFEVYFDYDSGDGVIPFIDLEYFDLIGFRGDKVEFGHKVRKPTDPYKDGYEFDGWYYEDEKWLFSVYVVTEDILLKAKFTEIKEPYSDIDKFDYTIEDGMYVIEGLKNQYLDEDFDMLVLPKNIKSMSSSYYDGIISTLIYNGTLEDWCNIEIQEYDAGLICHSSAFYYQDDNGLINFGGSYYKTIDRHFAIPSTITRIGDYQFYGANINTLTIPNTVTEIGINPFAGCINLKSITVDPYNTIYDSRDANAIFETESDTLVTGCKNTSFDVTIKAIGDYAFADCDIEGTNGHLQLPEGIETIGIVSFGSCMKLKSVYMPQTLKEIKSFAFLQCENIEFVRLNDLFDKDDPTIGLQKIGEFAFANCYSMTAITIPASVSEMGETVFQSCRSLEIVYFMSQRLTTIPKYTFYDCNSLTMVVLEANITTIKEGAFQRNKDGGSEINLYFSGETQEDFQNMTIEISGNSDFKNAKVYYFSYYKPNPFAADTYWHYIFDDTSFWAEIWKADDPEQD